MNATKHASVRLADFVELLQHRASVASEPSRATVLLGARVRAASAPDGGLAHVEWVGAERACGPLTHMLVGVNRVDEGLVHVATLTDAGAYLFVGELAVEVLELDLAAVSTRQKVGLALFSAWFQHRELVGGGYAWWRLRTRAGLELEQLERIVALYERIPSATVEDALELIPLFVAVTLGRLPASALEDVLLEDEVDALFDPEL